MYGRLGAARDKGVTNTRVAGVSPASEQRVKRTDVIAGSG